jgi:hypothetical protein
MSWGTIAWNDHATNSTINGSTIPRKRHAAKIVTYQGVALRAGPGRSIAFTENNTALADIGGGIGVSSI